MTLPQSCAEWHTVIVNINIAIVIPPYPYHAARFFYIIKYCNKYLSSYNDIIFVWYCFFVTLFVSFFITGNKITDELQNGQF